LIPNCFDRMLSSSKNANSIPYLRLYSILFGYGGEVIIKSTFFTYLSIFSAESKKQ